MAAWSWTDRSIYLTIFEECDSDPDYRCLHRRCPKNLLTNTGLKHLKLHACHVVCCAAQKLCFLGVSTGASDSVIWLILRVSEIAKRGLLLLLLKTATREIVGSLADHTVTHPLARRTLRQLPAISCATVLNL